MGNKNIERLTHPLITRNILDHDIVVYVRQSSERQVEEHKGSTEFQRAQVEIALGYGWRRDQVLLIDDDLGRSGTSTTHRPGFKKLIDLIASDRVKSVIAADTSRLSRNLFDFIQLLNLAARHRAILIIDGKLINPRDDGDTFVSRILGTVAEHENRLRAQTMMRAKRAKAQKGEVVFSLPVGLKKLS